VPDLHRSTGRRAGPLGVAAGLLGAAALALSGCGQAGGTGGGSGTATPSEPAGYGVLQAAPTPSAQPTPAAAAGGSCQLLDYETVRQATGTQFAVAASTADGNAQSCALQGLYADYPDLVLSVAPTKADAKTFGKAAPTTASTVTGLGQAAYSRPLGADGAAGPGVEVDWLGKNAKLLTLSYTFPASTSPATAKALTAKLVALAKQIEAKR
jgi:hypothetical protein